MPGDPMFPTDVSQPKLNRSTIINRKLTSTSLAIALSAAVVIATAPAQSRREGQ